jgi:hypothetical protein
LVIPVDERVIYGGNEILMSPFWGMILFGVICKTYSAGEKYV